MSFFRESTKGLTVKCEAALYKHRIEICSFWMRLERYSTKVKARSDCDYRQYLLVGTLVTVLHLTLLYTSVYYTIQQGILYCFTALHRREGHIKKRYVSYSQIFPAFVVLQDTPHMTRRAKKNNTMKRDLYIIEYTRCT